MFTAKIVAVVLDEEGLHVDVVRLAPGLPDVTRRYEVAGLTRDQFLLQVKSDLAKLAPNLQTTLDLLALKDAATVIS